MAVKSPYKLQMYFIITELLLITTLHFVNIVQTTENENGHFNKHKNVSHNCQMSQSVLCI